MYKRVPFAAVGRARYAIYGEGDTTITIPSDLVMEVDYFEVSREEMRKALEEAASSARVEYEEVLEPLDAGEVKRHKAKSKPLTVEVKVYDDFYNVEASKILKAHSVEVPLKLAYTLDGEGRMVVEWRGRRWVQEYASPYAPLRLT
ncbi:MAG: hypothetical protein DRJ67_04080 [Thermoprotei archaeon]|nr:MAG: hypothetical protein DRJ67_04080 [Thermoprotei archaeon]